MAYNTNNPVGSTDPRDLLDNAGNMDKFENGPNPSYPDRFGVQKLSRSGMIENHNNMLAGQESAFNAAQSARADRFDTFLAGSAYQPLGDYAAGLQITARNQVVLYAGEYYRAAAATALPYTLTGTWATDALRFVAVGDAVLRQDLANATDPAKGAGMVGYAGGTVADKLSEIVSGAVTAPQVASAIAVHDSDAGAHPALSAFITAEADRAETAADAAQLSAGVYPDTTAGLAATVAGEYFNVPSAEAAEFLLLYQNTAGGAVEIKRYPSTRAVSNLRGDTFDALDGMHRTSEDRIILAGVTSSSGETQAVVEYSPPESGLFVNGGRVINSPELTSIMGDRLEGMQFSNGRDGFLTIAGVTDADGVVQGVVEYSTAERALHVNGRPVGSGGETVLAPLPESLRYTLRDINHVIYYGQSLSNGTNSSPLLSTVPRYSNAITFYPGGPRATLAGSVGLNPGMDALGPLIENNLINDNGNGHARLETPCSGTINSLIERMAREDGTDWRTAPQWMASAAGKGGTSIANLSPGGLSYIPGAEELGLVEWFQVFRDHVSRAKQLADAAGKTYAVPAVVWMNGEGDNTSIGSEQAYYNALAALRSACNSYVKSVTGQTEDIAWLMYQTYGRTANDPIPYASLAQLRYARETPFTYIINPVGRFPRAFDNAHLSSIGSYWFGVYAARTLKRLLVDHLEPVWLYPKSATVTGRQVTVRFKVPVAPLLLDDSSAQMYVTTDYGFAIKDGVGQLVLSGIAVGSDGESVVLTVGRDLEADAVVRYGLDYLGAGEPDYSGSANGNLRDSNSETFTFQGSSLSMWSTCVHFQLPIIPMESI